MYGKQPSAAAKVLRRSAASLSRPFCVLLFTMPIPFSHYIPAPPLSDYIELLWIYEGYSAQHAKERLLPTGSMELVFALDEDRRAGCSLMGAQTQFTILDTSRPFSVMGVHFKPGGAFPFFGMPAGEFQGMGVPLDLVWGGFAGEVRDRLLEAKTHGAKYRILENALLAGAWAVWKASGCPLRVGRVRSHGGFLRRRRDRSNRVKRAALH